MFRASHLREQLELQLRARLAVSLAPLIAGVVDDPDDRGVLVADAASCWLALPAAARDAYQSRAAHDLSALEQFAWDYHARTEHLVRAGLPDPAAAAEGADPEEILRAAWLRQVRSVGERRAAGTPPAGEWLRGFPIFDQDSGPRA